MAIPGNTLVLATGNNGKVLEFKSLLAPYSITLLTPKDIGFTEEVAETGLTFKDNALLKAQALASHTSFPVLADDSGLIVDALNGAPGVFSARYSETRCGKDGQPIPQAAANRAKLLEAMSGYSNRRARFHCVLCYLSPGSEPEFYAGTCEGRIAEMESGEGGFGYDPLFIPEGHDKSFGILSSEVKDAISHRALAAEKFLAARIKD